jgi:peptide-methionine (S)-S-oxide reductase
VDGVKGTEVGYIGGHVPDATYEMVCSGTTGHAEAVRIYYDPAKVDYEQLLTIFWANHDPTQVNGQGVNIGDQYRSVIFFHDETQRLAAEVSRAAEQERRSRPIATGIDEASDFIRAEEYHQQYYEKQGVLGRIFR